MRFQYPLSSQIICLVFFVSGTSALIFESLWFRLAGLALGNSVWSAALILSGFMAGLALGNGLAAGYGGRIRRPLQLYAVLEIIIAITGFSVVFILPNAESWLSPLFKLIRHHPLILNGLRLSIAFVLLMIPTTAMGMTLPILVRMLNQMHDNFGWALGRLYGWNTFGAVFGALIGEILLIEHFGLYGTGLIAASLNLMAASIIFILVNSKPLQGQSTEKSAISKVHTAEIRLLAAAFGQGAVILSLEVVWFRFLLLYYNGTSLIFAMMLAIVLAGISFGGFFASRWSVRYQNSYRHLRSLFLLGAICIPLTYVGFYYLIIFGQARTVFHTVPLLIFFLRAGFLMLPVAFISGILFTLIGQALSYRVPAETRATGLLTLFNTLGAVCGSALGGFVLLPYLGMELSFFLLAIVGGSISLVVPRADQIIPQVKKRWWPTVLAASVFITVLIFFPFGRMSAKYFDPIDRQLQNEKRKVVSEGLNETAFIYQADRYGIPLYHRLVTNHCSMSATTNFGKRYMKLYVFLPVALHENPQKALLISYGVGSTAKALTDTEELKQIDIVDISKNVLNLSYQMVAQKNEHPLEDKRVNMFVEDGRFFLKTTDQLYDLITSEPPPPKLAGVVNLYSEEYFKLIYDRLADGGFVTYWLPVNQLYEEEAKSIIKSFCNAYDDCSLWAGGRLNWMLVGTRNATGPVSARRFVRQWRNPVTLKELQILGFETPEQLGATFLADSEYLNTLVRDDRPVVDNFPLRISSTAADNTRSQFYKNIMDTADTSKRFRESRYIKKLWPKDWIEKSLPYFPYQKVINRTLNRGFREKRYNVLNDLQFVLNESSLHTLPVWLMSKVPEEIEIADDQFKIGNGHPDIYHDKAVQAISSRDYRSANRFLDIYFNDGEKNKSKFAYGLYIFSLCMDKRYDEADRYFQKWHIPIDQKQKLCF